MSKLDTAPKRLQTTNYKLQPSEAGRSRVFTIVALVIWFGLLGLVVANRQNLVDWYRLRNYQAPASISQLATQDTLTDYARRVFYVNQPELLGKTAFVKPCANNGGEQTIVLGCYHPNQAGIYVLRVEDSRLDGVQQVTAAHEMLHAAYDRLSSAERRKVNAMLQDYYDHDLHDPRILSTMAAYRKSEPNDVVNEMHSIFGTEIAQLPAPLEQYYKRYFTNRQQVANFAAQYQSEFTSRQDQIASDDTTLTSLKSQIDSTEAGLKTKQQTISSEQAQLNSLRGSNVSAYNAAVPAYNQLVDAYNAQVATVQSLISQYNQLVDSRNAIALEEDQLVKDLSTQATPIGISD